MMELTFKLNEEMMQEAFQNALNNIEIQTCGMTLNECVEKQIAKKPIDKLMYIECPACGDVGIEDCAYCPVCGQKLDWSVENG